MPRAVLLDLDRTLVDVQSFTDYDAAWVEVRAMFPGLAADEGPDTGWTSSTRACMATLAALHDSDAWRSVSQTVAQHERAAVGRSLPMPGAEQFVAALDDRPLAVVTLLPLEVARDVLDRHSLGIAVVVGRDPHIRPKPSGDGLLEALRLLGKPRAGAVMVGDSTWDATAAADAGIGFIGVHSGRAEFARDFPQTRVCDSLAEVLLAVR